MKKCLVFGGAGFLGIHLCKKLYEQGYEVTVYNRSSTRLELLKKRFSKFKIIEKDFSIEKDFNNILTNVDIVFHLISTTNPANKNVLYDFESNVLPTIRLLDACIKKKIEKFIYFSSGGTVYGVPRYTPIDEGHRTDPISPYGIHKLAVEKCIEYYGLSYDLNFNILRISNPYGEEQNPFANQGVIAVFLAKALLGQSIEIWGNGNVIRDYIFVDDVIDACVRVISYKGNRKIFNIANGIGYSLNELIYIMQKQIKKIINVKYLEERVQDVPVNILDISLAQKELEWQPHICLEEGIAKMVDAWDYDERRFG